MAEDLVFYTHPQSRGRIVRWMLEEVGRPYRTEIVDYGSGMKSPAFLAVNPMGKVPVIRHGDRVVTESAAICAYLADVFPEAGLAPPPGDPARGAYYRWLFFTAGPFDQAFTLRALQMAIPEGGDRMLGCGSGDAVLDTIEEAVSGSDYLAGSAFTAADLYVAAHLRFGVAFKVFDNRPAFGRYVDRICSRPASQRAVDMDDALAATLAPAAPH